MTIKVRARLMADVVMGGVADFDLHSTPVECDLSTMGDAVVKIKRGKIVAIKWAADLKSNEGPI